MALVTARECPRKAFAQKALPRSSKSSSMGKILSLALEELHYDPLGATKQDIRDAVRTAFDANSEKMLSFEAEAERSRFTFLMERWWEWENYQNDWKLLGHGLKETVQFAGEAHDVFIDALVERKDHIEAIRFRYSSPKMNYRGRVIETMPEKSPDLLLLELAGEQAAAKHGFKKGGAYPVYASFFHMKSRTDKIQEMAVTFDEKSGDNIISHYFSPVERSDLENEFAAMKVTAANTACDEKSCRECVCNDLCHLEFVPHKLEEEPDVQLKKINEIKLTPDQDRFVQFDNGVVRVNAVAGAGKTTVVTLRTLALIEDGAKPENILMVTFTDKARGEMKQRLRAYNEGDALKDDGIDIEKIEVETFNSWGQKLVERYYDKLGFSEPPGLVDDVIKKSIIIDLLETHQNLPMDYRNPFMNTRAAQGAVTVMVQIIDALKACHAETRDDVRKAVPRYATGESLAQELLDMYNSYNSKLIDLNMLDYEDQLRLLLKLKDLGIFDKMPYEHVVVDEFQDSNPNQISIIVELFKHAPNVKSLVVVGDELQAIYSFRNATPENLVTFDQYFPNMVDIPLEDNFRSETPIIAMANHIIANVARIPKVIRSHSTAPGVAPAVINVESVADEQKLFVNQIKKFIDKDGIDPGDIAVLCRSRSELLKFQKVFDTEGIPTVLRVPKVVGEEPYVKAIIALAAFLDDSSDLLDFALYAKSMGQDPFDTTTLGASATAVLDAMNACQTEEARISTFLQLVDHCKKDYVGASFLDNLESKHFHTLRQYTDYCIKYRLYDTKETISTTHEEANCVSLITVHSAKGLEWPHVLMSMRGFRYSSEEERLLYVGVTRAKQHLLVTYTEKQKPFLNLLMP